MDKLSGLKAAYNFYQKVKASQNENAIETGAWQDAEGWVFDEVARLLENPCPIHTAWISTAERLPLIDPNSAIPISDRVLCEGIAKKGESISMFIAHYAKNGRFYGDEGRCYKVAYWQPLPKSSQNETLGNSSPCSTEDMECRCGYCEGQSYFELKDNRGLFGLPLSTLMECLAFAEEKGAIPPIDPNWWLEASSRHPAVLQTESNAD